MIANVIRRTTSLPRETAFAEAGVVAVAQINNIDPRMRVGGRIPFRTNGYVAVLLAQYPAIETKWQKIHIPHYHRYVKLSHIAEFDTDENAQGGLDRAELTLRINPGPGIYRTEALTDKVESGLIIVDRVERLSHVWSRWDSISRSVTNETQEDHKYRDGFVVRQATLVDREIYVTTFGEGVNTGVWHAWLNGNLGPQGFDECDEAVRRTVRSRPGSPD